MKRAQPCKHQCERRAAGLRYVLARWDCSRTTAHPSGYCKAHRFGYRWTEAQEQAHQAAKNPLDKPSLEA